MSETESKVYRYTGNVSILIESMRTGEERPDYGSHAARQFIADVEGERIKPIGFEITPLPSVDLGPLEFLDCITPPENRQALSPRDWEYLALFKSGLLKYITGEFLNAECYYGLTNVPIGFSYGDFGDRVFPLVASGESTALALGETVVGEFQITPKVSVDDEFIDEPVVRENRFDDLPLLELDVDHEKDSSLDVVDGVGELQCVESIVPSAPEMIEDVDVIVECPVRREAFGVGSLMRGVVCGCGKKHSVKWRGEWRSIECPQNVCVKAVNTDTMSRELAKSGDLSRFSIRDMGYRRKVGVAGVAAGAVIGGIVGACGWSRDTFKANDYFAKAVKFEVDNGTLDLFGLENHNHHGRTEADGPVNPSMRRYVPGKVSEPVVAAVVRYLKMKFYHREESDSMTATIVSWFMRHYKLWDIRGSDSNYLLSLVIQYYYWLPTKADDIAGAIKDLSIFAYWRWKKSRPSKWSRTLYSLGFKVF